MKAPDKNEGKKSDNNNEDKIKKQIEELKVCPYCQNLVGFIWVHGHYQCPICKNVVIGCCGDE
ncbi:MAG TPA: hypothetical protein VGK25_06170 [Ignavibacteria bacterium]|jgi:rubrerythrin